MNLEPIRAVLDRAAGSRRPLEIWWRDDDAVAASPALNTLLALGRSVGAPLAVAAIPAEVHPSLPERLRSEPGARILVHGWRHANHAPEGAKFAEFGDDRPAEALAADAEAAFGAARRIAGDLLLPVFVPPWNRIGPGFRSVLPGLGYAGLSTFGPREHIPSLRVINTHLDPVDWRGSRGAVEPARLAAALERALAAPDPGPIGVLTHHLVFDGPLWQLTAALMELLARHPAVVFPPLASLWRAEDRH